MFKFIYKIILIALISGPLTTLHLLAYGADAVNTTATANMTKTETINVSMGADGVLTRTDKTKLEAVSDSSGPLAIITMFAIGVIGTKLLMYKKWTLDMTIVAAASAAFILAELANIATLKSKLKDMELDITKRSDGKMDQAQIETLKKLKESYQAVKKSSQIKKMLQLAAAAAFTGATAVASYQYFTQKGKLASCLAAINNATATLTACPVLTDKGACTAALPAFIKLEVEASKLETESEAIGEPSEIKAGKVIPHITANQVSMATPQPIPAPTVSTAQITVQNSCERYYEDKKDNASYGKVVEKTSQTKPQSALDKILLVNVIEPNMSIDATSVTRNFLQKMVDALFPKADASIVSMLGLGVGSAAAYFTAQTAIGNTVDHYIFTPGARIILWGIFTGAALMASQSTQKEIEKVDGHIKKIDQILKDLNTLQNGVKLSDIKDQPIDFSPFKVDPSQNIPLNTNTTITTDCLASAGSSSCVPLSDKMKGISGFNDLPESFKSIANQSAQLGDGLSGVSSISGSTLGVAQSLGSKQAAIAKLNNDLKSKINGLLSKSGKPRDFGKEEKDLWNKMKAQTSSAFKSGNTSLGGFLASSGLGSSALSLPGNSEAGSNKKNSYFTGDLSGSSGAKDKGKEYDLDLKDKSGEAEGFVLGNSDSGSANGSGPKYDIGTNDINTNNGDSIFQVISNRYIKSAYPKFFDVLPDKK